MHARHDMIQSFGIIVMDSTPPAIILVLDRPMSTTEYGTSLIGSTFAWGLPILWNPAIYILPVRPAPENEMIHGTILS